MSKKASPPAPPATTPWFTILTIGAFGILCGATVTYFVVRPKPPATAGAGFVPAATNPDPSTHRPNPDLTAGQTPVQADRTLGNFYYDHQNWPKAIEHYQSAIRQGSDDADIRTDLGNAYRFTGRPDDALAQYALARKMNPNHEFSLFNQGGLFMEDFQQPGRAIEIWQEYLVRFPTGRNVEVARQLIAQAQGGGVVPLLPAPGAPPAPTQTSAAEALILRQIQSAQPKTGQP